MPIQFPQPARGSRFDDWMWRRGARSSVQRAPNLARPGNAFHEDTLEPGFGQPSYRGNLRELGRSYRAPTSTAVVNPAEAVNPQATVPRIVQTTDSATVRVYGRALGYLRMVLSGVTRDSAGAALGGVRVMIFRTEDKSFITEVLSDVTTGAWSVELLASGPFFTVDYLAGAPDRAGTSVNTLLPLKV